MDLPGAFRIGLCTQEPIRALAEIDRRDEYPLLFGSEAVMRRTIEATGLDRNPRFRVQHAPYGIFSLRNQLSLPSLLRRGNIDVYHSTNYMMPLFIGMRGVKRVVTIHNLIPLLFRDHAPQAKNRRSSH